MICAFLECAALRGEPVGGMGKFQILAKISWHRFYHIAIAISTEAKMQKYRTLRPRAYASEVRNLLERTTAADIRIDLRDEVRRIAEQSGMSSEIAWHDLTKAGVLARFKSGGSAEGGVQA